MQSEIFVNYRIIMNVMDGKSTDIRGKNVEALRELFPHVFSEGKIDLEKFKAAFCDDIYFHNERYTLNWAGKADAFKVLQERTSATLKPQPELSVNFDTAENVFIEGENLEVLKVLQKSYYNKIKCIIIDPPYNTGNDSFIYPDRFKENLEAYEKRVGEKDEAGFLMKEGLFRKNSRENGHYHSNWLNMMLPRLFLARTLLRDDGVIFVHIDDNEAHNLRLLMNEIFGEENFVAQIVWQKKYGPANDAKYFSTTHDYILCFSKKLDCWNPILFSRNEKQLEAFKNPDNDPRGIWRASDLSARTASASTYYPITLPSGKIVYPPPSRSWIVSKAKFEELVNDNRIWFGVGGNARPMQKKFLSEIKEGITPQTWWDREFADDNKNARYEIKEIFPENVFDTPKPTKLIKRLIEVVSETNEEEIILDFFSGSATTAHAVLLKNLEDGGNRKFILVQLPELCDENSEAFKAGYKTIADISRERIRRVISKLQVDSYKSNEGLFPLETENRKLKTDLGFKSYKLSPSNFKVWQSEEITEENLEQWMEQFIDPVKPGSKTENMLVELMLKSGYQLTDKVDNKGDYFSVNDNELLIALAKMDLDVAAEMITLQPQPKKVIALDRLFAGNDELKTNAALQMKDAGVEFKTI